MPSELCQEEAMLRTESQDLLRGKEFRREGVRVTGRLVLVVELQRES